MTRRQVGAVIRGPNGAHRLGYLALLAGLCAAFWALLHHFWQSDDKPVSILFFVLYTVGTLLGLLNFSLWTRGPSYYPAGKILALAAGLPGSFFVGVYISYGFNRQRLIEDVTAKNWNVIVYGMVVALELWATYLLMRQNFFVRPGSAIDPLGAEHRPTREMIREAVEVIERADYHDMLNASAAIKLKRDMGVRQALRWMRFMHDQPSEDKPNEETGYVESLGGTAAQNREDLANQMPDHEKRQP